MYLAFYGLKERPFNRTPDPKFLFLTPGHREALTQLMYGVEEQEGFIALTGEVGTGKTTLVRALLERLNGQTAVAFIANATLPFDGILEYMLEDLGIAKGEQTLTQRLVALNHFLIERQRAGQNALLILDEAQNLDVETLEKIRLLSNFETSTKKLLQILLVGQPELAAKLRLPELHQLTQRIGLRCVIPRLTPAETRHYVRTRLRIAGARDLTLFTDRALDRIAEYAGGIPRVVNIVCDHCLVGGYADQRRKIDRDGVEQAIAYLEEGMPQRRRVRMPAGAGRPSLLHWGGAAVIGGLVGAVAMLALRSAGDFGAWPAATMSAVTGAWESVRTMLIP
jgi:general secretion pathway protein A